MVGKSWLVESVSMKSINIIIKESFRRRKKQFLLLGLTLFISTLLLTASIHLIKISDQPFKQNFEHLKASHLLLFFDSDLENYSQIKSLLENDGRVTRISKPVPYQLRNGGFISRGKKYNITSYLMEYIPQEEQDHLVVLNPESGKVPELNEVWLPYHFSANYGIEVGDTLEFQMESGSYDFIVSSFVIDPHFLSGLFNPTRIFMTPGAMSVYQPIDRIGDVMVGVQMQDPGDIPSVYSRLQSELGFSGTKLEYGLFKSAFSSIYQLFGSILFFLSVMIFIIVITILKGTIMSHIYADQKQIGILKAIGFTTRNIRNIYLFKVLILCLSSIPIGLLAGYASLVLIIRFMNESTGLNYTLDSLSISYLLSGFIVALITIATTLFSIRKASKMKTVDSINQRINTRVHSSGWHSLKHLSSETIMALQFIRGKLGSSITILISSISLSFLILFIWGINSSLSNLSSDKPSWGFLDTQVQVRLNEDVFMPIDKNEFLELHSSFNDKTKSFVPFSYTTIKIIQDSSFTEVRGKVYDIDIQSTGFGNLKGSHPKKDDEISLCIGTARSIGAKVGDTIKVFIEGTSLPLIVSGIYQDIGSFGHGFRMNIAVLHTINPLFRIDHLGISLVENVEVDKYILSLRSHFGEKIEVEKSIDQQAGFLSIIRNLRLGIIITTSCLIIIICILISNDLHIHLYRDRIVIAKLKAIGFTNFQIKKSFIYKYSFILVLGISIGVFLVFAFGKLIVSNLTLGMGLPDFPFNTSFFGMIISQLVVLLFGLLSSWSTLSSVKNIHPLILKSE